MLEAILLDEGILTELRTAAVGAVAAQLLAPDLNGCSCIGILGTGIQARYQLRYLTHVTKCRKVKVWGRTEEHVEAFIDDMETEGWNVIEVDTPQHLLDCSLVVTTTSSREPLLNCTSKDSKGRSGNGKKRSKLEIKHPLHITCIGSDSTGKIELDPELVASADLLVADSRLQTKERGEFEEALKRGMVSLDDIVELGELAAKEKLHRKRLVDGGTSNDAKLTIFDSSGVAVQDCVIATMVTEALMAKAAAGESGAVTTNEAAAAAAGAKEKSKSCDKCNTTERIEYECCSCDAMMCVDCAEGKYRGEGLGCEPDRFHGCDGEDGRCGPACDNCYSEEGQCAHRNCEQKYCNKCKEAGRLKRCKDCGEPTCVYCEGLFEACWTRKAGARGGW